MLKKMVPNVRIESREGIVQEDDIALSICGTSDTDSLSLTARQRDTFLPNIRATD